MGSVFGSVRATGKPQLRIFGIPVRIEPVFVVIVLLLGLGPGTDATLLAGWTVIVFASVLLHELGHAFAFRAFGARPSIVLYGLGGVTSGRSPERRWQSVVVSLAGPVPPLLLVGLPAYVLADSDWARASDHRYVLLHMAVWVNLWWGLVNLLPLLPLDGGHVAEEFVGPRPARILTIVVAVPIAVYAVREDVPFGAFLAGLCAFQAWKQLRAPQPPPENPWFAGARLAVSGEGGRALPRLVDAALAGPAPPAAVAAVGDAGLAPPLADRILEVPGERPPVAVAEIAGGLLNAGRPGPAALVAGRLARDPRSPALREWAAAAAAAAWRQAGDTERASQWDAVAAELVDPPRST
jgi:Zn-dependent protease